MVDKECGFSPKILVLSVKQFESVVKSIPFKEAQVNPKSVHVYFLAHPPQNPDLAKLNLLKAPSERFKITDQAFFLLAPEGIGRSKLAVQAEKILGVPATARNWNTVSALHDMFKG